MIKPANLSLLDTVIIPSGFSHLKIVLSIRCFTDLMDLLYVVKKTSQLVLFSELIR